jgi:hypothetical protein
VLALAVFSTAADSFSPISSTRSHHHPPSHHHHRQQRRLLQGISSTLLHASTAIPLPHQNHHHHSITNDRTTFGSTTTATKSTRKKHKKKTVSSSTNPNTSSTSKSSSSSVPISAKDVWAERYCSVAGLREAFGKNRNVWWGDLDGPTTRRLYKRLLPVILLELRDQYDSTELAPLAYQARVAAKLYSRERSMVPTRVAAYGFDMIRQFCKYGKWNNTGLSYQQLFDKYATKCQTTNEQEVCAKILERSCVSNETIDRLLLQRYHHHNNDNEQHRPCSNKQWQELEEVSFQCEQDIRKLLQLTESLQNFRALRSIAKVKRRIAAIQTSLRLNKNNKPRPQP